jgi:hypothetical protein
MAIQDDILTIFKSYDQHNFEPSSCLQRCSDLLGQALMSGEQLDPRNIEKAQEACNAYGYASSLFLQNGFSSAATTILIEAWNKFSSIQSEAKTRIYRAGISMYLAQTYLKLGDKGAALRWALLTQADDLLGEHAAGGGTGKQILHTVLNMSETSLTELGQVASTNLEKINNECKNDWSTPYAYAEDVITKFAYNKPEYAHLFASQSNVLEFPRIYSRPQWERGNTR